MATTLIYVEQFIIGAVLLLTIDSLLWNSVADLPKESVIPWLAAYLLGVVYDRCADSLLERVNDRFRLDFAQKQPPAFDPFPENALRVTAMRTVGEVSSHEQYLRSRIRLMRSIATLLPAITIAAVAHQAGQSGRPLTAFVVIVYIAVAIANWRRKSLPKTYELRDGRNYARPADFILEPVSIGFLLLTVASAVVATMNRQFPALWIVIAGAVLTIITVLVWVRIQKTYRKFLVAVGRSSVTT